MLRKYVVSFRSRASESKQNTTTDESVTQDDFISAFEGITEPRLKCEFLLCD